MATEPDGFSDSAEVAWLAIDSIKLKGIRAVSAIKNKYLVIETATQLLSYSLWDVIEPSQQKHLEAETLLESKYKDYSCTEKPSIYPFERCEMHNVEHPNPFVYTYDETVQFF